MPHLDMTLLARLHGGSGSPCSAKALFTPSLSSSTMAARRDTDPTNSPGAAPSRRRYAGVALAMLKFSLK